MTLSKDKKSLLIERTKAACLVMLCLLAGCDSKESSSRLSRTLVLECSGQYIDMKKSERKPASFLIKVDPQNQFQQSLHFYNSNEKRFVSPCESAFPECSISANPDLLMETGVMRGSDNLASLVKTTSINRRTGSMKIVATDSSLGEITRFEGSCKKGELPVEQPQKF